MNEPVESPRKPEPERQVGPPVVHQGVPGGPAVLVLDPAGEAKHGGLPATWRPLEDQAHVVWLRLPAVPTELPDVSRLLDELWTERPRVHVLASGPAADLALQLGSTHPEHVGSVLLVDPVSGLEERRVGPAEVTEWERRTELQRRAMGERGIDVRIVATSEDDPAVARQQGSLPLGHPDVVHQVTQTILREPN